MKKNFFYKIVASLFLISAMLFISCSGLSESINIEDMATISVSIEDADTEARLVRSLPKASELSDLELKGTKDGGSQVTLGTWSNYSSLANATIKIPSGNWNFVFTCKKGSEDFSGAASASIVTGTTTRLSFMLSRVSFSTTDTTGSASGVIQYPEGVVVQTVMLNINNSQNVTNPNQNVFHLTKQANEIQNNSISFSKEALTPGNYVLEIMLFKQAITDAQYADFVQRYQNVQNSEQYRQLQQERAAFILENVSINFMVEAGLNTDLSQNFSYLAAPETSMGYKSVRALTDSDGKGYIEFVVKWPDTITYDENGSSVTRNVQAIEISREGGSGLTFNVGAYDNTNNYHPSTVVLCDRYELTRGQEYTYTLRYNWQWQESTQFTTTVTATADGFARPTIVCPTTTFDGRTLTCTNLNESDLNLNNITTQAERNRISDIRINFNYYDETQPDDWGGSTRVYTGFSYRNNSPVNLWNSERSGVVRKLYESSVVITCGNVNRTFSVPENQLQRWAEGKLATTLRFAEN